MRRLKKLCFTLLRCAVVGVLLLIGVAFTYACVHAPYYSHKYARVLGQVDPVQSPAALTPISQDEAHTCGLLALSSVYVAYGLDPVEAQLRFRLGVDKTAVPFATGTEGTLHPDLFRVASQDGFQIEILDPADPLAKRTLLEHLTGNAALALIPIGDGLHWIALDYGGDYDELRVSDSLETEAYFVKAKTLLATPVLSLMLLSARRDSPSKTTNELHASGLAEMKRVHERMRAMND